MSKGITHADVGSELAYAEYHSDTAHQLASGTSFPGSPSERELYYRTDLHAWYIYDASGWQPLGNMPGENNTYDLGSSSYQWQDIYIDGIAYLDDIYAGPEVMIRGETNTDIYYIYGGLSWLNPRIVLYAKDQGGGNEGYLSIQTPNTAKSSNISRIVIAGALDTSFIRIGSISDFRPDTTNTIDLGTSGLQWKDIYVNGVGYIDELRVGDQDSLMGVAKLSGAGTGSSDGGELRLELAADHDTTIDYWAIDTYNDDIRIWANPSGGLMFWMIDSFPQVLIDNTDTGSTVDSPVLKLIGNYYDTSDHTIETVMRTVGASDPYFRIGVSDDGATPTTTNVLRIYDDKITPNTTNTVDLGFSSLEWKDLYVDGLAYIDGLGESLDANDKNITNIANINANRIYTMFDDDTNALLLDADADNSGNAYIQLVDGQAFKIYTKNASQVQTERISIAGGSDIVNIWIRGPCVPGVTSQYDLGESSFKWQDLYLSGNISVDGTVDTVDIASFKSTYDAHDHSASDPTQVDYSDLLNIPSTFTPSAHEMVDSVHTDSGLTAGYVIRASGSSSFAWAQLGHGDLSGVTSDQHHDQQHSLSGSDHTGDLAYSQLDAIVDISGGGTSNMISAATHVHTAADGSSKVDHGAGLTGLGDDDHSIYLLASGARAIASATPTLRFDETDQTNPAGEFRLYADGDYLYLQGKDVGDVTWDSIITFRRPDVSTTINFNNRTLGSVNKVQIADNGDLEGFMGPGNAWGLHHPETGAGGYDAVEITIDDPFQIRMGATLIFQIGTGGIVTAYADVVPYQNAGASLGTDALEWNNIWIDGTAYLDAVTMHGTLNFNASAGTNFNYLSRTGTEATDGAIRLVNTDSINWRNQGNTANLGISVDSSNRLAINVTTLYMASSPYNIKSAGDLLICDQDATADFQHDIAFFGDGTNAQAGAFYNKVKIFGGSAQTRHIEIYQEDSGNAYLVSDYEDLIISATGAGSSGIGITVSNGDALYPTITNQFDLGTASLKWETVYTTNIDTGDIHLQNGMIITEDGPDTIFKNKDGVQIFKLTQDGDLIIKGRLIQDDD